MPFVYSPIRDFGCDAQTFFLRVICYCGGGQWRQQDMESLLSVHLWRDLLCKQLGRPVGCRCQLIWVSTRRGTWEVIISEGEKREQCEDAV